MHSSIKQSAIKEIWDKANKHSAASSVGIPADMDIYELCECCHQPIVKEQISIWEHTKQFEIFGFGYPLWFSFVKYCIILVLVLIATRTGSQIYMATKENYDFCYGNHHGSEHSPVSHPHHDTGIFQANSLHMRHPQQSHFLSQHLKHSEPKPQSTDHSPKTESSHEQHHAECTSFMIYLSIFKGQDLYQNYFLRILSFLIHLAALIGIRNNLEKQEQYYDERTCSLSDYSVLISNLPPVYGVKDMVVNFLRDQFGKTYGNKNSQVKDLIYIFQDQEVQELRKKLEEVQEKKLNAIEHDDHRDIEQLQAEKIKLQIELDENLNKLAGDIRRDYIKCDKVVVVFNTQADKGQVLQKFQEGKQDGRDFSEYFNHSAIHHGTKYKIEMKEAPEPNEINWQHIDESDNKRKFLILRGWCLTILFLAVVTIAFYFIMLAKTNLFVSAIQMEHHNPHDQNVKHKKIFATVIVFVALFGVILFNKFIMGKVLHIFVHMERHAYTDKEGHSFAMKYSLGMFFTTALMTLAVQAITFRNFYSHQYGVIEEQTIMFFVTAFFIPLVWAIHPYNLAKKFQLSRYKDTLVPQQKANQLIEDFEYDLGKRYAEIFEIMWFTFLYSELIPLGSFLILIGLVLYYWVDKYNFLRRSALKAGMSGKMSLLSLKSLDATLFLAPAGKILFGVILRSQIDWLQVLLTLLGIIYLFVPISKIIWFFNGEKFLLEDKTYDEVKYSFKQTYMTNHPAYQHTHKKQIEEYSKKVAEYYRAQLKKIKMFGAGRGNFTKDNLTESMKKSRSRVTQANSNSN